MTENERRYIKHARQIQERNTNCTSHSRNDCPSRFLCYMKVQYYRKNVYGKELIYLIESEETNSMLRLIGQSTISRGQIELFKKLGIQFEEVIAP